MEADEVTLFRLDVSRRTGGATLLIAAQETPCGFKPLLVWSSAQGVKDFAQMLLDMCYTCEAQGSTYARAADASVYAGGQQRRQGKAGDGGRQTEGDARWQEER